MIYAFADVCIQGKGIERVNGGRKDRGGKIRL
jgi:hypothetical protein